MLYIKDKKYVCVNRKLFFFIILLPPSGWLEEHQAQVHLLRQQPERGERGHKAAVIVIHIKETFHPKIYSPYEQFIHCLY